MSIFIVKEVAEFELTFLVNTEKAKDAIKLVEATFTDEMLQQHADKLNKHIKESTEQYNKIWCDLSLSPMNLPDYYPISVEHVRQSLEIKIIGAFDLELNQVVQFNELVSEWDM